MMGTEQHLRLVAKASMVSCGGLPRFLAIKLATTAVESLAVQHQKRPAIEDRHDCFVGHLTKNSEKKKIGVRRSAQQHAIYI